MATGGLLPVWHENACKPRKEVLEGTLTEAELALSLSAVVSGRAKPPYNDPVTFFEATHTTRNMKDILENILGRLSRQKADVNPIIVLDVGFGGGKTHTLVALFYAARDGARPEVAKYLGKLTAPKNARVVAISGEEYGDAGVKRDNTQIRTIWGDLFWQLGSYKKFESLDKERKLPSLDDVQKSIEGSPVLILLDELPTYMKTVAQQEGMLDKTVQFIQRLVLAVAEKEDAALMVAIAEDAYRVEAEKAKQAISEAVKEAMEEARAHIRRKEAVLVPVQEEDVVHILKRRLFQDINKDLAKKTADSYKELYSGLPVPDKLKSSQYRDEIENSYPFHPALIKVLYERVATIDRFQRTRGALRLLSRVIRRVWKIKEQDAILIHPFHVDLAEEGILNDLTTGIGEERRRNAVEADVASSTGDAVAQQLDEQSQAHWGAPLVRRACNTIYLYSLATGKEGDRGVQSDLLISLCTTPLRSDHFLRLRDTVLGMMFDQFHHIDRLGERFVFIKEPTPIKVIELTARDVTEDESMRVLKETLGTLFAGDPDWVHVEPFPHAVSSLRDEPFVKVAVLNPNLYTISSSGSVPDAVSKFLVYKDDHGKRLRQYTNSTFLLVASQDRLDAMRIAAKKQSAASMVREDLTRYGIPKERKTDVEEYLAMQKKNLNDYIRAAFSNLIYYERDGVKPSSISASGYGSAKGGRAVIAHYLVNGLHRVVEESHDPSYVLSYVWPKDAVSISTKALYEQFHAVPGLILPSTKEIFQKTVERGIKEGMWVLKHVDKVYTHEKPPPIVAIEETAELITIEEAERKGLLKEKETEIQVKKPKPSGETSPVATTTIIPLSAAPIDTLAKDLEKRAHRDRFNEVNKIDIKIGENHIYLINIKNLLTRLAPDKTCGAHLSATLSRYRSPSFTLTFSINKEEANNEEGKALLDLGWKLKGVENCDITFTIDWPDGTTPENASKLLQSLAEGSKEPIIASLEAKVSRRS